MVTDILINLIKLLTLVGVITSVGYSIWSYLLFTEARDNYKREQNNLKDAFWSAQKIIIRRDELYIQALDRYEQEFPQLYAPFIQLIDDDRRVLQHKLDETRERIEKEELWVL